MSNVAGSVFFIIILEMDGLGWGGMSVGKWVNVTFIDLDAHGSADCLAIFKLGHDKKHATQGPVSQQRT